MVVLFPTLLNERGTGDDEFEVALTVSLVRAVGRSDGASDGASDGGIRPNVLTVAADDADAAADETVSVVVTASPSMK